MSDILCVTNRSLCHEDFLQRIRKIAACQPKGIILREKDLSEAAYKALAENVMQICKQNDVPYALVLAIIEHESGYEFDKVGDGGQSKGYMQIYEKWHTDRMKRLNCTDLMNPYQNVRVGIDFLSYLLKKYGTVQDALAAYNYGEKGAREHLWSNGVYVYSYNSAIMQRMKEIEEVVGK